MPLSLVLGSKPWPKTLTRIEHSHGRAVVPDHAQHSDALRRLGLQQLPQRGIRRRAVGLRGVPDQLDLRVHRPPCQQRDPRWDVMSGLTDA